MRNFGLTTRAASGEQPPRGPHTSSRYALPSNSILASGAAFERSRLSQALIDVLALGSFAVFICSFASAVGILGYVAYLTIVPKPV